MLAGGLSAGPKAGNRRCTLYLSLMTLTPMTHVLGNPFRLDDEASYRAWRARKLANYPSDPAALTVTIEDINAPSAAERAAIIAACRRANLAIFSTRQDVDKTSLRHFGQYFGLNGLDVNLYADEDGISALQVSAAVRKRDYIPYTNQRLNWHTDGYYNQPAQRIRSFMLFCVQAAAEGGENQLLDPEIAYILLRDADPRWIAALQHPQAMTIPANIEQGRVIRGAETGPVFSVDRKDGSLHMRYSARTRNIEWRADPLTRQAVEYLAQLWRADNPYVYHHRLMPGQGLICNNILHNRSAFRDDPASGRQRLMYRARYYDRILGTGWLQNQPPQAAGL